MKYSADYWKGPETPGKVLGDRVLAYMNAEYMRLRKPYAGGWEVPSSQDLYERAAKKFALSNWLQSSGVANYAQYGHDNNSMAWGKDLPLRVKILDSLLIETAKSAPTPESRTCRELEALRYNSDEEAFKRILLHLPPDPDALLSLSARRELGSEINGNLKESVAIWKSCRKSLANKSAALLDYEVPLPEEVFAGSVALRILQYVLGSLNHEALPGLSEKFLAGMTAFNEYVKGAQG